jgi:hypothetical protein
MTDQEWEQFKTWWAERWPVITPDRESVEQYLEYLKST